MRRPLLYASVAIGLGGSPNSDIAFAAKLEQPVTIEISPPASFKDQVSRMLGTYSLLLVETPSDEQTAYYADSLLVRSADNTDCAAEYYFQETAGQQEVNLA